MNEIDADRMIYAFTGLTREEYVDKLIAEWQEYLAAGGDPDNYKAN